MSFEQDRAEEALTPDQIVELREYGIADARETFQDEMLAHWYWDVKVNEPPNPQSSWLRTRYLDYPCEAAFTIYRLAYKHALTRAMAKLDDIWERYANAIDNDENATEIDNETTDACVNVMEEGS